MYGTAAAPARCRARSRTASPSGSTRGRLSVTMPPPVMCARPCIQPSLERPATAGPGSTVLGQQRLAHRGAQFVDAVVDLEPPTSKKDLARQRVAVGVKPRARQPDEHVALFHLGSIEDDLAVDHADDETGEIVVAVTVETGHLGGLAAEQRAAGSPAGLGDALDHLGEHVGIEHARGEVVQEEQRLGALDQDVVDAVVDQVPADRVVDPGEEGDLAAWCRCRRRWRPGPARHTVPVRGEQPAEATQVRQHARRRGSSLTKPLIRSPAPRPARRCRRRRRGRSGPRLACVRRFDPSLPRSGTPSPIMRLRRSVATLPVAGRNPHAGFVLLEQPELLRIVQAAAAPGGPWSSRRCRPRRPSASPPSSSPRD